MEIFEGGRRIKLANFPYDVLGEIFVYCLPENSLKVEQPDTSQAPMVLCQICSTWREVALDTPRLWKYLYYIIGTHASFPDAVLTAKDLVFLRWWCDRLRTIKPLLRLGSARRFLFLRDMSSKSKQFLLDLINSAYYLNLDVCFTKALIDLERYESVPYTNLDTLVLTDVGLWDRWGATSLGDFRSQIPEEVQRHAFPVSSKTMTIRRLIMDPRWITKNHVNKPSIAWSNLTHFYACILTERATWYTLIRECVNMVSGHFNFSFCEGNSQVSESSMPPPKTLPCLRELVIGSRFHALVSPLCNLVLPDLLILGIDNCWISVDQLNEILVSTPGLQRLRLSPTDLFPNEGVFISGDASPNSLPLRNIAPNLKSIHFGGHVRHTPEMYKNPDQAKQALLGPWLSLWGDVNNITELIFSSDNGRNYQPLKTLIESMKEIVPSSVELIVRPWSATSIWSRQTIVKLQFPDIDDGDQPFFPGNL